MTNFTKKPTDYPENWTASEEEINEAVKKESQSIKEIRELAKNKPSDK